MNAVVRAKFDIPILGAQLLATNDHELVEGNVWYDYWWGVYNGKGENHLGKILMSVREELQVTTLFAA